MKIEIKTTTVKLSKSIINQMVEAAPSYLHDCTILGYVVNIVKDVSKSLIIYRMGKYYTFPCNWSKGNSSIYRRTRGLFSVDRKFKSTEECNEFWERYQSVLKSAEQIYI